EVLALARRCGDAVAEVPVAWADQPGSKVRLLRDGPRMARDLWRLRRRFAAAPPPEPASGAVPGGDTCPLPPCPAGQLPIRIAYRSRGGVALPVGPPSRGGRLKRAARLAAPTQARTPAGVRDAPGWQQMAAPGRPGEKSTAPGRSRRGLG